MKNLVVYLTKHSELSIFKCKHNEKALINPKKCNEDLIRWD